jgi:hypothetical protein
VMRTGRLGSAGVAGEPAGTGVTEDIQGVSTEPGERFSCAGCAVSEVPVGEVLIV